MPNNRESDVHIYIFMKNAGIILAILAIILAVLAKNDHIEWMWALKTGFLSALAFLFNYFLPRI